MKSKRVIILVQVICLMLFINCSQAQVTVLPLSDFQQIKLNGTLSLDAIVDSQTMEQTLSQLSTFVSKTVLQIPLLVQVAITVQMDLNWAATV